MWSWWCLKESNVKPIREEHEKWNQRKETQAIATGAGAPRTPPAPALHAHVTAAPTAATICAGNCHTKVWEMSRQSGGTSLCATICACHRSSHWSRPCRW